MAFCADGSGEGGRGLGHLLAQYYSQAAGTRGGNEYWRI